MLKETLSIQDAGELNVYSSGPNKRDSDGYYSHGMAFLREINPMCSGSYLHKMVQEDNDPLRACVTVPRPVSMVSDVLISGKLDRLQELILRDSIDELKWTIEWQAEAYPNGD